MSAQRPRPVTGPWRPDPQVIERAKPRQFSAESEARVVREAASCRPGEIKCNGAVEQKRVWVFDALEVWWKVWAASLMARRTYRSALNFSRRINAVCDQPRVPTVVTTDEFKYHPGALRRTFGPSCVVVQVKNRHGQGRIVHTRWHLVLGTERRYDWARKRLEDGTQAGHLVRGMAPAVRAAFVLEPAPAHTGADAQPRAPGGRARPSCGTTTTSCGRTRPCAG